MGKPSADMQGVPQHIGIILDGNRRWAKAQGKPAAFGHSAGADRLDTIIQSFLDRSIPQLTAYAFSSKNWSRQSTEVSFILGLVEQRIRSKAEYWKSQGVRICHFGQFDRLPNTLQRTLTDAIEGSLDNTALTVNFCLSYDGRDEIVRAVQALAHKSEEISEDSISAALDSAGVQDPDLIIRTSGEQRLSGFLLWQSAYSELYFTDTHWPDFDDAALDTALDWYAGRQRRFGK